MTLIDSKTKRLPAVLLVAGIIVIFGTEIARLTMSLPGQSSSYFWPMLGLGVGLALSLPLRYWPWLIVLIVGMDAIYLDKTQYNMESTLGFLIEYASYYVVVIGGCWLIRRRYPDGLNLARLNNDLRDFLIMAALMASATALLEPAFRIMADAGPVAWRDWFYWFTLDLMSILTVAPFIFSWISDLPARRPLLERPAIIELAALLAATYVIFAFDLYGPMSPGRTNFDFVWVIALWGIFRFDLRIVATIVLFTVSFVSGKTNLAPFGFGYLGEFWQDQSLILTTYASVATSLILIINTLVVDSREKRTEINRARTYLDSLIQATGTYLWIYNVADRNYEYFSDTDTGYWTDHIGMRDIPGNIFNYLHPGDDQTAKPIWNRILNGEQKTPFNFAYRLINEDGDIRWDHNIGIPLLDEDGNVERYVGMILDITDEQELRAEKDHLHDVIRESEKLNAIGTLSAGMAHDWNNLLLVLSMEATRTEELSQKLPELKETVAALNQIVTEGRGITEELMALARREREPTSICDLYEEVPKGAELLARAVPRNISVTTELEPDSSAKVRCKVTHLMQIILNLGLNARDAIGDDGGKIEIHLVGPHAGIIDDRQRSVATLQISDNGKGIPEDEIEQVLQPLFTTKAARGGTGLGLAVVRGFVAEMDGEISIESVEGAGTIIAVVLPVVPERLH